MVVAVAAVATAVVAAAAAGSPDFAVLRAIIQTPFLAGGGFYFRSRTRLAVRKGNEPWAMSYEATHPPDSP